MKDEIQFSNGPNPSVQINTNLDFESNEKDTEGSLHRAFDSTFNIIKGIYRFSSSRNLPQIEVVDRTECRDNINNEESAVFSDIPVQVQLVIFLYLDIKSLCRSSRVCSDWLSVINDPLLWNKKLTQDSLKWQMVDHLSHPKLYKITDLSSKEIYIKCCPEYRRYNSKYSINFPKQIPNLRYYFGFSIPRVVMFGSGLDSSGLVRGLLWSKGSPFVVKGMFPGQFDGIGSGVTLQYTGGTVNMITLYGLSKSERENQQVKDIRQSRLLVQHDQTDEMILSPSVKELISTVDAFIYIVNATDAESVIFGKEEFDAMTDNKWLSDKIPVLVLCVVPEASVNSVSSLDVADQLDLLQLTRPWQVRQCHLDSLYGFIPGVNWLNKHVMCI